MLKEIVFLIWEEALLDRVAQLKEKLEAEGGIAHIWGKGAEPAEEGNDAAGGGEKPDGRGAGREDKPYGGKKEGDKEEGNGGKQDDGSENVGMEDGRKEDGEEDGEREDGAEEVCDMDLLEEKGGPGGRKQPRCLTEYEKESTLFVTDKGILLRELKRLGRYVIALLYENNGQEDFSGASYAVTDIGELSLDSFDKAYRRMAGKPWTVLETERCTVRETTVEDVDEFYRIYAEPSITYYMDRLYDTPEEEKAYTREYIEKIYGFYGYGMWSVVQRETGRVIGRAGLSWREGFDLPEIGFVIEVACQRMGYAYEVCRAIVDYGMEELGFCRIQALVEKENEASAGLCRKLGFEREDSVESGGKVYERFVVRNGIH